MAISRQNPANHEIMPGPEVIRLSAVEVGIPVIEAQVERPEYADPRFLLYCENVLEFFVDKPSFTYKKSGAGPAIRDSVGVDPQYWPSVANELIKVSGALTSLKSEEAKRLEKPNRKIPPDTFIVNPDIILNGSYPYFTAELKEAFAEQLLKAEQNN